MKLRSKRRNTRFIIGTEKNVPLMKWVVLLRSVSNFQAISQSLLITIWRNNHSKVKGSFHISSITVVSNIFQEELKVDLTSSKKKSLCLDFSTSKVRDTHVFSKLTLPPAVSMWEMCSFWI